MEQVSYAEAIGKFKPEQCVFVISVNEQGEPNGMICGWAVKCSVEPPLYAVALSKKGNTQDLIRKSQEFVVAIPNKELEEELKYFGSVHGFEIDKFAESKIETMPAQKIKPPLIKNATINFECQLFKEVDCGDHYLFIGEVLASYMDKDKKILFNMKKVDGERVYQEL